MAKAPIPIATLYDWLWWIGYSCKYQTDCMHIFFNRPELNIDVLESVEHFYCSPEWEQWSFHNHGSKMADKLVWASHKQPLKRYIRDYDGDAEYYACKVKVKSAHSTWGYQLGIDSKLNIVHFGRLCASRVRLQQKYGDSLLRLLDRNTGCSCECCVATSRRPPPPPVPL